MYLRWNSGNAQHLQSALPLVPQRHTNVGFLNQDTDGFTQCDQAQTSLEMTYDLRQTVGICAQIAFAWTPPTPRPLAKKSRDTAKKPHLRTVLLHTCSTVYREPQYSRCLLTMLYNST
jgi:hypothetical protein